MVLLVLTNYGQTHKKIKDENEIFSQPDDESSIPCQRQKQ